MLPSLPPELILHIASYLPQKPYTRFLLASRRHRALLTPDLAHAAYRTDTCCLYVHHAVRTTNITLLSHLLVHFSVPASIRPTQRSSLTNEEYSTALTPLHRAAQQNAPRIAQLLLFHGALMEEGCSLPLAYIPAHRPCPAEEQGRETYFCVGLNPHQFTELTALQLAAMVGAVETLDVLIANNADVNYRPENWQSLTALHFACWSSSANAERCVRALLEAGADPGVRSAGYRPLHLAARAGNGGCVRALIEAGVDVEERAWGCSATALCVVAECCWMEGEEGRWWETAVELVRGGAEGRRAIVGEVLKEVEEEVAEGIRGFVGRVVAAVEVEGEENG